MTEFDKVAREIEQEKSRIAELAKRYEVARGRKTFRCFRHTR
jgi:hypothetical protein